MLVFVVLNKKISKHRAVTLSLKDSGLASWR